MSGLDIGNDGGNPLDFLSTLLSTSTGSLGAVVTRVTSTLPDTATVGLTTTVTSTINSLSTAALTTLLSVATSIVTNLAASLNTLSQTVVSFLFQLSGSLFSITTQVTTLTTTITTFTTTGSLTRVIGCSAKILKQITSQCNGIFTSINALIIEVSGTLGTVSTTTISTVVTALQQDVQQLIVIVSKSTENLSAIAINQIASQLLKNVFELVAAGKNVINTVVATLVTAAAESLNSLIVIFSTAVNAVLQIVAKVAAVLLNQLPDQALQTLNCLLSTVSDVAKNFTPLISSISSALQCSNGPLSGLEATISKTVSSLANILTIIAQQISVIIKIGDQPGSAGGEGTTGGNAVSISKLYTLIGNAFAQIYQNVSSAANQASVYDVLVSIVAAINVVANCYGAAGNIAGNVLLGISTVVNGVLDSMKGAFNVFIVAADQTNVLQSVVKTVTFIVQNVFGQLQGFAHFIGKCTQGCNISANVSSVLSNLTTVFEQVGKGYK